MSHRVRSRQAANAAANRPQLQTTPGIDDQPTPAIAGRTLLTSPVIPTTHPTYWQVHRVESRAGVQDFVLIAECRTEADAFRVTDAEAWQCRIRRWGSRLPPYISYRPVRVVD